MNILAQSMLARSIGSLGLAPTFDIQAALELGEAEQNYTLSSMAFSDGIAKIDTIITRALLSANVDVSNKELVIRDRLETRLALNDMGLADDDADTLTCGFESAKTTAALGNEAWVSLKKIISDAIAWVVRQLEDAAEWIMKVFNKYFGAFESQKANWESLVAKANEAIAAGKVLDSKEKWEVTRGVNFYTRGGTIGDAGKFGLAAVTFTKSLKENKRELELTVPAPADLLDAAGALKELSAIQKLLPAPIEGDGKTSELADRPGYTNVAGVLFGEVAMYSNLPKMSEATDVNSLTDKYKSLKMSIMPVDPKAKIKDSLKMDYCAASDIVTLGERYMELLDMAIFIVRGGPMAKLSKSLTSATKDLKNWAKDVPSEDASFEVKTTYRAALNLVTSYVNAVKRIALETPNSNAKYVQSCSVAHYAYAAASLKMHVKL